MHVVMLLAACSGPSPDLVAARAAVSAWDAGVDHLDGGEPDAAIEDFERGLSARPGDVLLLAWRARAEAESGQVDRAVTTLDAVLSLRPDFAEARYNRAAYIARLGRIEEAAEELSRALADGARRPEDVLGDSDFRPHLGHPALAFLPRHALKVVVEGRSESAFWGAEIPVRLLVVGNEDEPVQIALAQLEGPAEIIKAVQDTIHSTDGLSTEITWTLRVTGAGVVTLGPWTVTSAGRTAEHPAIVFEALAPADKAVPTSTLDGALPVPSEVAGERDDLELWREGALSWVKVRPGDRLELAGPSLRLERRRGPVLEWVAHGTRTMDGQMSVIRGGREMALKNRGPEP